MLRHAHFYMKGGKWKSAAGAREFEEGAGADFEDTKEYKEPHAPWWEELSGNRNEQSVNAMSAPAVLGQIIL